MIVQRELNKIQGPIEVSELVKRLRVNKTTVYRQLERLIGLGEVQTVEFGDGKKRYEIKTDYHHHHLVCNNCSKATCFEVNNDLGVLEKRIRKDFSFKVSYHNLEFFGLCNNCQK